MYSQSDTLYDILTDALWPGTSKATTTPSVDSVIGSISQTSQKSSNGKQKSNSFNNSALLNPPYSGKTLEVNAIQANPMEKASKGKKKGKGKSKPDALKPESSKPHADDGSQHKPKYPYLICEGDHYAKDYPQRSEVSQLLKGSKGTSAVLKEPFPSQHTQMVEQPSQSTPFGSQVFMMNGAAPMSIATHC